MIQFNFTYLKRGAHYFDTFFSDFVFNAMILVDVLNQLLLFQVYGQDWLLTAGQEEGLSQVTNLVKI